MCIIAPKTRQMSLKWEALLMKSSYLSRGASTLPARACLVNAVAVNVIKVLLRLEVSVKNGFLKPNGRRYGFLSFTVYTDKKENLIFLIYREIQSGAVAKSYMTNGLLNPHIWGNIFAFPHILHRKPFLCSSYMTVSPRADLEVINS